MPDSPENVVPGITLSGVRALPEEFEASALIGFLAEGWGFDVETADYAAVGGGSYHWVVRDLEGTRGFVTVDDLDHKPWLGDTRESVLDELARAFDTAVALHDGGLGFVVAPIPTSRGETMRRLGPRYTVALFPFVDGQAGRFGEYDTAERAAILTMLAALHRATPPVSTRRIDLELPGRRELESALLDLSQPWSGGPLSEQARELLAPHASFVTQLLALFDRLSAEVASRSTNWVVTHGEPHAANVMRTAESHVLIDWDTVALAPPERDLWMLVDQSPDAATTYADSTGNQVGQDAVNFFRLTWTLADVASFTNLLRSPHRDSADTKKAYNALTHYVTTRDHSAALLE
jgi:spectinomycin phosphotransferase